MFKIVPKRKSNFTLMSGFQRAKKQLISLFLMNLESRPMMFEDVARQVMALKTWYPKDYYIDAIGKWVFNLFFVTLNVNLIATI